MKTVLVLCVLVAAAVGFPGDTYDAQFDHFNAEELAQNPRLLKNYGKCFLNTGPCTSEGTSIKKVIPEALSTTCAKCSPKQRSLVRTVVRAFQAQQPEIWNELVKKEDPQGLYTESFNKFVNSDD